MVFRFHVNFPACNRNPFFMSGFAIERATDPLIEVSIISQFTSVSVSPSLTYLSQRLGHTLVIGSFSTGVTWYEAKKVQPYFWLVGEGLLINHTTVEYFIKLGGSTKLFTTMIETIALPVVGDKMFSHKKLWPFSRQARITFEAGKVKNGLTWTKWWRVTWVPGTLNNQFWMDGNGEAGNHHFPYKDIYRFGSSSNWQPTTKKCLAFRFQVFFSTKNTRLDLATLAGLELFKTYLCGCPKNFASLP